MSVNICHLQMKFFFFQIAESCFLSKLISEYSEKFSQLFLMSFKGCPMQTQLFSASVFIFGPAYHYYALFTSTLSLEGRTHGRSGKAAIMKFKTIKRSFGSFPVPWKISALLGQLKETSSVTPVETTCHLLSRYEKSYFSSSTHAASSNPAECFARTGRPLETKHNHLLWLPGWHKPWNFKAYNSCYSNKHDHQTDIHSWFKDFQWWRSTMVLDKFFQTC